MANPFSFLSPRRPEDPSAEADRDGGTSSVQAPSLASTSQGGPTSEVAGASSPLPAGESLFFRPIPYMAPQGTSPSSVITAAHQGSVAAAAAAGRMPPGPAPSPLSQPLATAHSPWAKDRPISAPPANWVAGQISSREFAQLRVEVREEFEQVKNDVFGAATGVSAVKDRLDGLELRMVRLERVAAAAAPTREEIQSMIRAQIEHLLQAASLAPVLAHGRTLREDAAKAPCPDVSPEARPPL